MRKFLFGGVALASLIAGPAVAADMAVKAPIHKAPPSAPVYSWTGFYAGAHAGYGWSNEHSVSFTANDPLSARFLGGTLPLGGGGTPVVPPTYKPDGGFGGFQVGFNWQLNPSWLAGLETDVSASAIKDTGTTANLASPPGLVSTIAASQRIQWFGTVRARLGWLPSENWLLYATGGFAYGRVAESINVGFSGPTGPIFTGFGGFSADCAAGGANCFVGISSRTATGWTVGAGSEYLVTRNVTLKAEYLYVNLGSGDSFNAVAQLVTAGLPSSFRATWGTVDFHTIRAGFNYKLDAGPVARY